jgi:hypothetical protein
MNGRLTSYIDAGGPQGISQLLILKDVMERLSKDEHADSQGVIKPPCEVFDVIGGVGTGGSVWFTFALEIHDILTEIQVDCHFSGGSQNDSEGRPGRIQQICCRDFQGHRPGSQEANGETYTGHKWCSRETRDG